MHSIVQQVQVVRSRWHRQRIWQAASTGLLTGGITGLVVGTARVLAGWDFSWLWIATLVAVPALVGLTIGLLKSPTLLCAARRVDRECGLKDRVQTALQFLTSRTGVDAVRELQVDDAAMHLQKVDAIRLSPIEAPRSWRWGIIASVVALLLATLSSRPEMLQAAAEPNAVVMEQAERVAESLQELEQFQKELPEPELEQLLKELNEQIRELSEPGTDPKEALAKLSEMEAALQQMQQQLAEPSAEQQLREIGEALSLAKPLAAAGEAMSKGNMDKAAEELAKAELPELDRKTQKAVTEKLAEAVKNNGKSQQKKSTQEATDKICEGLSQGNASQFKDGMKGLASECKKQGNKKKLSDLLKKQCECLSECKSECEGEGRNQAQGNKKGGQQAGKGTAGNEGGDKSDKLKSPNEVKLTGQDSGQGDSDIEKEAAPDQEQEAVRQYRSQAEKYEALSESALESESIPLGHRQTIRRYFELIRPQGSETDAVKEATVPAEPKP